MKIFLQNKTVFLLVTLVRKDTQSFAINNFSVNNPFEVESGEIKFECRNNVFIAPPLKIRFSVPVERVETSIFNPRVESCCFNPLHSYSQILKRVAMKNSIHYSKQNTAKAFRVIAALVSLG